MLPSYRVHKCKPESQTTFTVCQVPLVYPHLSRYNIYYAGAAASSSSSSTSMGGVCNVTEVWTVCAQRLPRAALGTDRIGISNKYNRSVVDSS